MAEAASETIWRLDSQTASIYWARAARDFADGFVAVLLPVYLSALGHGAFAIGVISTAAILGNAVMTIAVGLLGSRTDHRRLLMAAAALMTATGLAMASVSAYPVLLLIAFIGTINASAGGAGIFGPLEQAVLAGATPDSQRTSMFARYSLIGSFAAAAGALAAASPDFLLRLAIDRMTALRAMFVFYALLGLIGALLYRRLPPQTVSERKSGNPLGPSRAMVYKLAALFSIDSFASGFAVQSLFVLWLFNKFGLSLSAAGLFFFWSGVLAAFSFPVAAWLSRRIGLINTMVYTHIPSSLCLIAAALVPSLELALTLLLARAALSQMDVPTRTSYVMAVVTPPERAAAASFTAVPRSLATAVSPTLAGWLYAAGYDSWPLILCGVLKIVYDLALLWVCRDIKPPEER